MVSPIGNPGPERPGGAGNTGPPGSGGQGSGGPPLSGEPDWGRLPGSSVTPQPPTPLRPPSSSDAPSGGAPGAVTPPPSVLPATPRPPAPTRPAPTGSSTQAPPANGRGTPVLLPDGWVGTVTDRIVTTVDGVRAKTTAPIEKVGRIVIWGLLIATAGVVLLIALLIGSLRLAYELVGNIPGISGEQGRSVWIIDVLVGVGLISLGFFFVKKGTRTQHED